MLTNSQMIENRFAKLARGRRIYRNMVAAWDRGGVVRILNSLRCTDLTAKHRDLIVLGKSGSLYIKAGKRMDCIDFCKIQYSR